MWANPSIERTPNSQLRCLSVAAHVKRQAAFVHRRCTFVLAVAIGGVGLARAEPVVRVEFPAVAVSKVVLRAGAATEARVVTTEGSPAVVRVSATATGGAQGYHPADPNWKETPASEWGLGFVAQTFGSTLVISSRNEILYIHHSYALENIQLEVPPGVQVTRERRPLNGDGKPNLSAP